MNQTDSKQSNGAAQDGAARHRFDMDTAAWRILPPNARPYRPTKPDATVPIRKPSPGAVHAAADGQERQVWPVPFNPPTSQPPQPVAQPAADLHRPYHWRVKLAWSLFAAAVIVVLLVVLGPAVIS